MSNMKRWLQGQNLSYRRLGFILGQSDASISQKVNGHTAWQQADLELLHDRFGLSSDFVLGLTDVPSAVK